MTDRLFLIASIAGRSVAIESETVESVVDIGAITEVPRAGGNVRGLAALRSKVVTVIDTTAALGLPGNPDARRAVITQVDGQNYALLVDALEDIAPFELHPVSSGIPLEGAWADAGTGLVERDGEPILAIDVTRLVPTAAQLH